MSDEDVFKSAGTQLGIISNASLGVSGHFKFVGSQEVHISKQHNTDKK